MIKTSNACDWDHSLQGDGLSRSRLPLPLPAPAKTVFACHRASATKGIGESSLWGSMHAYARVMGAAVAEAECEERADSPLEKREI